MANEEIITTTSAEGEGFRLTLCSACELLDLGIHKFIISNQGISSDLAQSEPASRAHTETTTERISLNSGTAGIQFATFGEVQGRRNNCRFCNLTWRAVERYSSGKVQPTTGLFLAWEVDGRHRTSLNSPLVNRTRRIRLTWSEVDGKEENIYLVLVAPSSGLASNSDAYAFKARDSHFLGRGCVNSRQKQSLIKSWIDLCAENHGLKCQREHSSTDEFKKLINNTYFGVVDVVDMQLKALPIKNGQPERYVALSYVWGKPSVGGATYTTTRSNVMRHIQHGRLGEAREKLPQTIQDAILLVGRLGERYLWVDSLCIVQDSISSWELNAKAMHLVYGNAYFTICAGDGDATTGLRAVDPILRGSQLPSPRVKPHVLTTEIADEMGGDHQGVEELQTGLLTTECLPGIRLLVSRPPEAVIQNSVWNQRGWTFQERLLSRRCLIFAEGQVYFQCRSGVMSEDIFTGGGSDGWSLNWTNSPLRTLGELRRKAFWFYMKCVKLYTGRSLTKQTDILTAFQGISWLLQQYLNAPLFYGLPASHFDLALLWTPTSAQGRRKQNKPSQPNNTCSQDELGNCNCRLEQDGYGSKEFPSWSWCGWIGGNAGYQHDMIEGCLLNVHQWLKRHTWILWYYRDQEGNLRPLWDRNSFGHDLSKEYSWRGYVGASTIRPRRSSSKAHNPTRDKSHHEPSDNSNQFPSPGYPFIHGSQPYINPPHLQSHGYHYPGVVPYPLYPFNPVAYPRYDGPPMYHAYQPQPPVPSELWSTKKQVSTTKPEVSKNDLRPLKNRDQTEVSTNKWYRRSNSAYLKRLPEGYYEEVNENEGKRLSTKRQTLASNVAGDSTAVIHRGSEKASDILKSIPSKKRQGRATENATTIQIAGVTITVNTPMKEDSEADAEEEHFSVPNSTASTVSDSVESKGERVQDDFDPRDSSHGGSQREGSVVMRATTVRSRERSPESSQGGEPHPVVVADDDDDDADNADDDEDFIDLAEFDTSDKPVEKPSTKPSEDVYGRRIRPTVGKGTEFTGILPDNPFGITRGPFLKDGRNQLQGMPILQFWTWRKYFDVINRDSHGPSSSFGTGLCQCSIVDEARDWCGSIVLQRAWIQDRLKRSFSFLFIAISDAKSFAPDECPVWTYYIPKEKDESEWDLYYVLLLERNHQRGLWERVGLGKVFQAAFGNAIWDEIKLG